MENPVVFDPPPSTYTRDDLFPGDADPLAIPPLDHDHPMFSGDLAFEFDPELNIEDLDVNFDDFLFDSGPGSNSEATDHHSSLSQLPAWDSDHFWLPDAGGFNEGVAVQGLVVDVDSNRGADRSFDDPRVSDVEICHNDRDSSGQVSSHDSHDGACNFLKASNYQSSGSDLDEKLSYPSPDSGSCDQIGSHGSGVSPVEIIPSPVSSEGAHAVSSSLAKSKKKIEEAGSKVNPKRKKEQQEEGRTSKIRKSAFENASINVSDEKEDDEKKKARLIRNRESALLSRQRKKQYVEELEDKVRSMHSTITELNNRVSYAMAENATLKQQLSGGGVFPPIPPYGMHPMAPMGYPWMPYPPYAVKQGSQVPLVPIPRLKPQRPVSAPKVSKKPEKTEKKKSEGKTKKLASISFLGLLFFMLLFGCLVPIVNNRFGGVGGKVSVVDRFNDVHRGRTLMIDDGGKSYSDGRCGHEHGHYQDKQFGRIPFEEQQMLQLNAGSNGSVVVGNSSEPIAASLYVPRNDKLVRIDGNLIIQSVLASDRAAAVSLTAGQMKTSEETRLAIARNYIPTYHGAGAGLSKGGSTDLDRDHTGKLKALGSSVNDNLKAPAPDGRLQKWLLEDLAGPVLSSGICTEVFQFEVTPLPGSVVPATSMANIASEYGQTSTRLNRSSRRILREHSIPLKGHAYNLTKDKHAGQNAEEVGLQGNKSSSSIVVSVLVDPREATDVDSEGMFRPKSLSRIFVVVLIDSVKYVTYSCMLPLMGSSPPHLVTA